ncbi:1864_t:CDS:2, partial [Diversispora eburnea]
MSEIIISYLNQSKDKSFWGFLCRYRNEIVAITPPTSRGCDLDNDWAKNFIREAQKLEDLNEKVNSERQRVAKKLEDYWNNVIAERETKEDILVREAEEARIQDELSRLRHKLSEIQEKLAFEISELRQKYVELEAKNIEVEVENTKLKQDKKEVEARFLNLEQRDREKTDLIAKLKHNVSLIKEQSLQNENNRYTPEQIVLSQRESDVNIPNPVISQCISRASSTSTNSKLLKDDTLEQIENNFDNTEHRTSRSSGICQERDNRSLASPEPNSNVCQETETPEALIVLRCSTPSICIKNKSSEDIAIDEFLDLKEKERVSNMVREKNREKKLRSQLNNISQSNKNKVQKFMSGVSTNSSSQLQYTGSISNSSADNDAIPTTLNEIESQPSNTSFTFLYEKLCNAIILADRKTQEAIFCYCNFGEALIQRRNEIASEKQIDPESNAVSRILNKEVRAQLPANISDVLLWKRIEKAKKLYKLFSTIGKDKICRIHSFSADSISKMTNKDIQYIIDNVPFDYSIKIEFTLKSKNPELSSGSDNKNSFSSKLSQENNQDSKTEASILTTSSIQSLHTSNSEDMISEDNKSPSNIESNARNSTSSKLPEAEVSISQ